MKGGNKTTYRQWKQTQKIIKNLGNPLSGGSTETIQILPDTSNQIMPAIPAIPAMPIMPAINYSERKEKLSKAQNLYKSKQTIEKQYATFGKQKGAHNRTARKGGKISILIKDHKTQKKIEHEKNMLDKHEISKVRAYLRNRCLLKVGSTAPDDVLRELYKNAF